MSTVCVGLVFRSKYVQFPIICSHQYSINYNTVEVDPNSDLLHICIVKPKNSLQRAYYQKKHLENNFSQGKIWLFELHSYPGSFPGKCLGKFDAICSVLC